MGNQKTKSKKSKTNSANTYSNPNANTVMKDQEKCQKCGSTEFVPVCYGYPTEEAMEKYERGELILRGCCAFGENPTRVCKICNKDLLHNNKDDDKDG